MLRLVLKSNWLIMLLFSAGLILAGCASPVEPPEMVTRNPFSLRSEGEDGILVEWSGNSSGHVPGGESGFEMRLVNQAQDPWKGKYCFQLLDKNSVVTTFDQSEFSLDPGGAISTPLWIEFPENLAEGPYGLAFVITGRLSTTATIYIGDTAGEVAGSWPAADCP